MSSSYTRLRERYLELLRASRQALDNRDWYILALALARARHM